MKQLLILITLFSCHLPKKTWADSFRMVSLGDSFSAATNANSNGFKEEPQFGLKAAPRDISWVQKMLFKLTAWPEYSFSTGNKIESHCKRLKHFFGDVECTNLAVPGDRAEDVANYQLPKALAIKPDYVVIEIGYNNLFQADTPEQMTSASEYYFWVERTIETLRHQNKDVMIVLAPLADLSNISDLLKDKTSIWWLSCKTVWKLADFAPIVTSGDYVPEVKKRLSDYNGALWTLKKKYGERVYFNEKAAMLKIEPKDISKVDCLHPSINGHKKMAEVSWPSLKY